MNPKLKKLRYFSLSFHFCTGTVIKIITKKLSTSGKKKVEPFYFITIPTILYPLQEFVVIWEVLIRLK